MSALALALAAALLAAPAAETDPVFRALDDELSRARTLKMDKLDKPYHFSLVASDSDSFSVSATFGALVSRGGGHSASLSAKVRVGSPRLDNTNFSEMRLPWHGASGRGGAVVSEPDYDALRHALWLKLDDAYKAAVETIAKKRAYLETNQVVDRPDDFSAAKVMQLVLPRQAHQVNRQRWTALVKRASSVFRAHQVVQVCSVTMQSTVSHEYQVSSEGGRHRFAEAVAKFTVSASTQAEDGMELMVRREWVGRTEADLPKDEEVMKLTQEVARQLEAKARAPSATEDYAGPVLFLGRAAPLFFLQAFADPLSAPRDELGTSRQGRLTERLGKRVAPREVSVRDDPTLREWHGRPLLGYFPIDDDGVKPQPITLVENGVLKTYYMSRIPTAQVKATNGHSRAGQGSAGSLFVETNAPAPREQLKRQLIELAREEDLEYGLLVEELDEDRRSDNLTSLSLSTPRTIYRVYLDGREELVRGLTFKNATFRTLKDIVAMGDEPALVNTTQRNQNVSAVAPSVLVKMLELQKSRDEKEKPPLSPRPVLAR